MGGRIRLESEVGLGSTFEWTSVFGPAPTVPVAPRPEALRDLRVLVVDDNATNRRILLDMLANWSLRPRAAAGVEEAVGMLRSAFREGRPFEVVLTDANMPDLDGFDLAERVRDDPELASTVLMMLTSGSRPEDLTRCEELGVVRHMTKPVKQSELLDAIVAAIGADSGERPREDPDGRARPTRPLRILLAEDSEINRRLAVALLEQPGHTVVSAKNGREALDALETESFDVVLMDVQMPEMDGLEVTRRIREREGSTGGHVPIVALTAHALKGDRERCLKAGMDGYVAKPIRPEELFLTIESVTGDAAGVHWEEALEALGGNRKLLDIISRAALEESPRLLQDLRNSIAAGDAAALRIAAHSLRGGFRYFGQSQATDLAARLERMGETGNLEEAGELLDRLESATARMLPVLSSYLRGRD
jgi:CheY-like chemotaxis protein